MKNLEKFSFVYMEKNTVVVYTDNNGDKKEKRSEEKGIL